MSVHLDLMLACLLGVLLAKPFLSSVGQGSPIVSGTETKSLLPQSMRGSERRSLYHSGVWGAD